MSPLFGDAVLPCPNKDSSVGILNTKPKPTDEPIAEHNYSLEHIQPQLIAAVLASGICMKSSGRPRWATGNGD